MFDNLELCRRFADGTGLCKEEIAHARDAGLTYSDGTSWMLTEQGRYLLMANRPLDADSSQCHADDSYLAQRLVRHEERMSKVRAELDPNGKGQHETGAKLDAGKVRLGLVLGAFSNALIEVGKVGTYGAQKYTDNGWLDVPKGKARYTDALLRHIFAEANDSHDPDTNLHHAAHAAWNALARLELILRKRGDE